MGKSSKPQQEVTEYYMSIHFGICAAADKIKRIIIKEKEAWVGSQAALGTIAISKRNLFGGPKKEGGVAGTVHWLPGAATQVLPDALATRLGRANGADAPGYRGIATAWFVGGGGSKLISSGSSQGFYWSANSPYLPGVWIEVERAPVGLDPEVAMIPRLGEATVTYSTVTTVNLSATGNAAHNPTDGLSVGVTVGGFDPTDIVRVTEPSGGTYVAWSPWGDPSPVSLTAPKSGAVNWFMVIPDGETANEFRVGSGVYDGYETARAAFGEHTFTGSSSYTFYIEDNPVGDNTGGVSILVERGVSPSRLDANPAHIVYECLTNTDWGMGSPTSLIDTGSFNAAAQALFDESFGLSMIWTRQASIQDFIQEVLDHIQAVLFVDPTTGLLTLKLIRGDYDPDEVPELTPSNADLTNFGRKLWGEIINEIVVTWTNPDNEQDETVTVQDLASIVTQGGIVSDGRNYYGVRTAELAQRLAARDLRASGAPLATCEAEVDRSQYALRPASVLSVTWPEYGLEGVIMRVTDIDYGKPGDATIKLSLMEDVFGLDVGEYTVPPSSGFEDPSTPPAALEHTLIFTLPLFMASATTVAAFVDSPEYPEVLAGVLGTTSDEDTFSYELWDEVTLPDASLEWQKIATENIIGRAELAAGISAEASSTISSFANFMGLTEPTQGGFVIIGDGAEEENEIALVTATGVSVTLDRGVLDTVPKAWPAGTPVWFVDRSTIFDDPIVRSAGETVSYKMLTQTSQGLLDLGSAPLVSETLSDRPWLPNRPANVQVASVRFNTVDTPVDQTSRPNPWVTISWARRNRLTEDSQVLSWTDGDVTPETGQTTTVTVFKDDGSTVLATHTAIAGTSYDVPDADFGTEAIVLIDVSSSRTDADGTFVSLQSHGIWVQVAPVRMTEASETRLTEDGGRRRTEA